MTGGSGDGAVLIFNVFKVFIISFKLEEIPYFFIENIQFMFPSTVQERRSMKKTAEEKGYIHNMLWK